MAQVDHSGRICTEWVRALPLGGDPVSAELPKEKKGQIVEQLLCKRRTAFVRENTPFQPTPISRRTLPGQSSLDLEHECL
eukprot:NODE_2768_length_645_cov_71.010067_g2295_i0.p4 GENE.NODE_2768_length_645_cov_71.010067_g2295_i0~~NODE_2768_length_645_cov_71.010067_g2295_i0.p4  ORF type:complete len:80 (-),score=13.96 NODE_2768_length_645_cov_71.010067_g2295_i0:288-527(-)